MSQEIAIPKRRIGRGTSAAMVAVALVLDFAVIIILVAGFVLSFSFLGVCADSELIKDTSKHGMVLGALMNLVTAGKCVLHAGAAVFSLTAIIWTFPAMAAMVSAIAGVVSVLLFTVWFAALRVSVMGLSYRRVMVNLTTAVIESIPGLNLLPMQTVAVVLHIRITHKEDDRKIKQAKSHAAAAEAKRRQEEAAWEDAAYAV